MRNCVFLCSWMNSIYFFFLFLLNELQQSHGNHFKLFSMKLSVYVFFAHFGDCGFFFFFGFTMFRNPSLNGWRWMWILEYHRIIKRNSLRKCGTRNRHQSTSFSPLVFFPPICSKFRRFCRFYWFFSINWYSLPPSLPFIPIFASSRRIWFAFERGEFKLIYCVVIFRTMQIDAQICLFIWMLCRSGHASSYQSIALDTFYT